MNAGIALRSSFSRVAARPSAFFAEFAWRWTAGLGISVLLLVAAAEYLNSIDIFNGQAFSDAGTHLLRVSAVLLGGVALLVTFAAAAGRNAALLPLITHPGTAADELSGNFGALLWLNFLRAALVLAAVLATAGAWLIAGLISPAHAHAVLFPDAFGFWLVFCPLLLAILVAWAWLYWIIALAPLPALVHHLSTRDALAGAVGLICDHPLDFAVIGLVFGVLRLGSMWLAAQVALTVFASASISRAAQLGWIAVIAAAYFVFSDYLFISRMGAFAALIQNSKRKMQN